MCIKLIDTLSGQTQLIAMRIDTELITYLEHVLIPQSFAREQQQSSRESEEKMDAIDYQVWPQE
jgi:hypothetical protein